MGYIEYASKICKKSEQFCLGKNYSNKGKIRLRTMM